jgi:hypothetical protein
MSSAATLQMGAAQTMLAAAQIQAGAVGAANAGGLAGAVASGATAGQEKQGAAAVAGAAKQAKKMTDLQRGIGYLGKGAVLYGGLQSLVAATSQGGISGAIGGGLQGYALGAEIGGSVAGVPGAVVGAALGAIAGAFGLGKKKAPVPKEFPEPQFLNAPSMVPDPLYWSALAEISPHGYKGKPGKWSFAGGGAAASKKPWQSMFVSGITVNITGQGETAGVAAANALLNSLGAAIDLQMATAG